MKRIIFLTCVALAVGTASAQKGGGNRRDKPSQNSKPFSTFDDMDANHDGKITLDEFKAVQEKIAQQRFAHIDANGDGAVSREEFDNARKLFSAHGPNADKAAKHAPDFESLDKDGNGSLSRDEATGAMTEASLQRFERMDKNGDGVITRDEWDAAMESFRNGKKDSAKRGDGDAKKQTPDEPAKPSV